MPEYDALHERGRALEEEYFRKKDRELIEKMRQAAAAEQAEREIGARTRITDPEVLRELAALGFTPDTVVLLPLLPVLRVAWAEGGITDTERRLIVKLARARGIAEHSPADAQLSAWMTSPPGQDLFTNALRLVRAMLAAQPEGQRELDTSDLVRCCEQIAGASGPFLSLQRVSADERQILADIRAELALR